MQCEMETDNPMTLLLRAISLISTALLAASCASGKSMRSLDDNTQSFVKAAGTWDKNRDGTSTCEEWKAYATRLYKGADSQGDGFLDAKEYKSLSGRDALFFSVKMPYFDANGDNRITQAEFVDKPNPAFTTLDANRDCGITIGELAAGPQEHKNTITRDDLLKDDDPK